MTRARLTIILSFVASLICGQGWAAVPAGSQQYIVRVRHLFVQPNASAPVPIQSVVGQLGGHLDFDLRDWLVITIPEAAYQAIRAHPAVKYLQRVVRGPFAPPAAGAATESSAKMASAPQGLPPWSSGTYSYDGAGNIKAIGSDAFLYDGLSRLVSSNIKGNAETYEYDPFGNLTKKTTTPAGGSPLPVDLSVDATTNHLSLQGYDAAGNMRGDSAESNAFDPVSMQREKDIPGVRLSELYVYNAADERVGVFECIGPPASCTNAPMMWSLRDESGKVLRQYEGTYVPGTPGGAPPWAWKEDYVYREGLLLGGERVSEEGGRRHFHLDHLGTARLVTNSAGGEMAERDYYPFGVQIAPSFQDTANGYDREEPMRFTGHERDFNVATTSENANYNDFMHARPTVPQWGRRFLSVDPIGGNPYRPQTWNRYAYALNNPLRYVDPLGLTIQEPWLSFFGEIGVCGNPSGCGVYFYRDKLLRQARRGDDFAALQLNYSREIRNPFYTRNIQPSYDELIAAGVFAGLIRAIGIAGGELGLKAAVSEGVEITFGHGARHLEGTALKRLAVESAIKGQIQTALRSASQSGSFWGRVSVEGVTIEYRAFTLEGGAINVGTYYPVP